MTTHQKWSVASVGAGSSHSVAIIRRGGALHDNASERLLHQEVKLDSPFTFSRRVVKYVHDLASYHREESQLLSWGRGEDGQLGHGVSLDQHTPCIVEALEGVVLTQVICGAEYTVAICDGRVYSWGWGDFGRLGHTDGADVFLPRSILPLAQYSVASVSCGDAHTLAVLNDGKVLAFGRNQNGQLGNGSLNDSLGPLAVQGLGDEQVVGAACGAEHSVVVTQRGRVYAFGWGRYGNLGIGTDVDECLPVRMRGLEEVHAVRVACGWRHSMVVDNKGQLFAVGWGKYGQLGLGDGETRSIPVPVCMPQKEPVLLVDGGWRHTVVSTPNALYTCGWNKFGQLGLGVREDAFSPTRVEELCVEGTKVTSIACGWRHTLVVTDQGSVYAWGRATNGQLGFPSDRDVSVPAPVQSLCTDHIDIDNLRHGTVGSKAMFVPEADRYAIVPTDTDECGGSPKRARIH